MRLLSLLLLLPLLCQAQDFLFYPQLRSLSLANATVASAGNDNPAGLSLDPKTELDLTYYNLYFLPELSLLGTSFTHSFNRKIEIAAQLSYFGFQHYNENRFGFSASKQLFSFLHIGMRLNYQAIFLENEEWPASIFSADIGVLYTPSPQVIIGLQGVNFLQTRSNHSEIFDRLPRSLRVGTSYSPLTDFTLLAEVAHIFDGATLLRLGSEYFITPELPLRIGYSTDRIMTFGTGYRFKSFTTEVAAIYHYRLGMSLSIGIKTVL